MIGKVSVIIPVYNGAECVGDCLDSIISQSYSDIEIIVVNDGSTDNTQSILLDIKARDKRIRLIENANKGVSASRNDALKLASGDYITFVDADDKLLPHALANMVKTIQREDVEVLRTMYMGNDGDYAASVVEKFKGRYANNELQTVINAITDGTLPGYVWLLMYKNIDKFKSLRFDVGLSMMEDTLFYVSLLKDADSIYISDSLTYEYAVNRLGASRSAERMKINIEDVMNLNAQFTRLAGDNEESIRIFSTNHVNIIANIMFEAFYSNPLTYVKIAKVVDSLSKRDSSYLSMVERGDVASLRLHLRYTIGAIINRDKVCLLLIFIVRSVYRKTTGRSTL